jgi:hypothetical protein
VSMPEAPGEGCDDLEIRVRRAAEARREVPV